MADKEQQRAVKTSNDPLQQLSAGEQQLVLERTADYVSTVGWARANAQTLSRQPRASRPPVRSPYLTQFPAHP